jgi:hypothetical protein
MDGVDLRFAGDANDLGDRQIGGKRSEPLADLIGLVGLEAVEGELVLFSEDRDGLQSELIGGPEDADRDLGPIGDKDLADTQESPLQRSRLTMRHPHFATAQWICATAK